MTARTLAIPAHLEGLAQALRPILALYPEIAAVWVFGSVARGTAGPASDLDLGLLFKRRGETALDHHRLLGDLASRLEAVARGRQLDLVVLESQGPLFGHRVLREGVLVYEADRARRVDFESTTLVRAFDYRPTWELATRGRIAAVRRRLREMK